MLPYFIYTEDIQSFCQLMEYTIDESVYLGNRVCMYRIDYMSTPFITAYSLGYESSPLIPPEKVIDYLTLILNEYSFADATKEIGVGGNRCSSSS